ncbi:NADPH-dependent F420 reductase [Luteibacter sp.]|uniref:NADPH-dependent F420 reductase n=1 Tax=Luteibacter sp. TaxID=1886636 RepID=UPI002F418DCA
MLARFSREQVMMSAITSSGVHTMKIGIIGAGNIGHTLARRFRELGHDVLIANSRGPETLTHIEQETGAVAVTSREAARGAEVVIVTIPEANVAKLPRDLFDGVPEDTVVVDTGNYYPQQRDGRIGPIEDGVPESQWTSDQLGRPVIKAFNNIYAEHLGTLGKPSTAEERIALPVSGDDENAKAKVLKLIDELGFDGVDAGSLSDSWRQQPGSPVYGADRDQEGVRQGLLDAQRERSPEWRATEHSPGTFEAPR